MISAEPFRIRAATLYDGVSGAPEHDIDIVISDGLIQEVVSASDTKALPPIAAEAPIVTPGFIDLQLNGAGGVLFNDAPSRETLKKMAQGAAKGGTSYFLPTFITDREDAYLRALDCVKEAAWEVPGVVGIHLEGPFLSPKRPGIHPADCIRPITDHDIAAITGFGLPLLLTLAPEEATEEQIKALSAQQGVYVFAGHSEASLGQVTASQSLRGATHLFNAMSQITPREPGLVGAVCASDTLFAGIIADGIHVHPENLRFALKHLGADRLFLVSDAMAPLGTDITEFDLLGKIIHRQNGRLCDINGTLAGADLSMIEAVRNMNQLTGCGIGAAVRMATSTAAKAIGLDHSRGQVAAGKRAGLTLLNAELDVEAVYVDGILATSLYP